MKMRIPALFLFASLALAACSDDNGVNPGDLDRGDFEGTVRGEFSADVNGSAESGNTPGFGQDQILLTDVSEETIIFVAHSDDEFTEGRESLAGITDDSGIFAGIVVGNRVFFADGGTLDIDDVSSGGIEGTVEFTAIEVNPNTQQILDDEVTVDVAFNTDYDSTCCGLFNVGSVRSISINKVRVR